MLVAPALRVICRHLYFTAFKLTGRRLWFTILVIGSRNRIRTELKVWVNSMVTDVIFDDCFLFNSVENLLTELQKFF